MADAQTIAGMRDRMIQLHRIADMAHSKEITDLVLKVADDIQAEINRLERGEANVAGLEMPMPPPIS